MSKTQDCADEVLRLTALGWKTRPIARRLGIARRTVDRIRSGKWAPKNLTGSTPEQDIQIAQQRQQRKLAQGNGCSVPYDPLQLSIRWRPNGILWQDAGLVG